MHSIERRMVYRPGPKTVPRSLDPAAPTSRGLSTWYTNPPSANGPRLQVARAHSVRVRGVVQGVRERGG